MQQHPLCSVQTGRLSQSSIIFSEVIALSEPYKIHDLLLYIVKSSCHDRCLYHVAATSITYFFRSGCFESETPCVTTKTNNSDELDHVIRSYHHCHDISRVTPGEADARSGTMTAQSQKCRIDTCVRQSERPTRHSTLTTQNAW